MRQTHDSQPSLTYPWLDLDHAKELKALSDLLDQHPTILDPIWQDLSSGVRRPGVGARGMTAEQVFRALILKQMKRYSYSELHFHLADSRTYRTFCRLSLAQVPARSTLAGNIKRLRAETLEKVNRLLVEIAVELGIEKGRTARVDCTVVETNIHPPSDSQQLWDCVRVLTRLLGEVANFLPAGSFTFPNRQRRAKRRCREISTTRNKQAQRRAYLDLLRVTQEVGVKARHALDLLEGEGVVTGFLDVVRMETLTRDLRHYLRLMDRVVDQTRRRVLEGESVPASEKIVSIFEEHTDVIRKDYRETYYGHKVCLTGGKSSMILDCQILEGNPADSTLALAAVTRQKEIYGQPPRQVVFDGGFASTDNLEDIKELGPRDVVFTKGRYLKVSEMAKSIWVYRNLQRFRAGIEGCISFLKRVFGLDRCTWRTLPSFESYVWSSIVSCNLLLMARALM